MDMITREGIMRNLFGLYRFVYNSALVYCDSSAKQNIKIDQSVVNEHLQNLLKDNGWIKNDFSDIYPSLCKAVISEIFISSFDTTTNGLKTDIKLLFKKKKHSVIKKINLFEVSKSDVLSPTLKEIFEEIIFDDIPYHVGFVFFADSHEYYACIIPSSRSNYDDELFYCNLDKEKLDKLTVNTHENLRIVKLDI